MIVILEYTLIPMNGYITNTVVRNCYLCTKITPDFIDNHAILFLLICFRLKC